MSSVLEDNNNIAERRAFPRINANCPVLYQPMPNSRWIVARLLEYSATGISMVCDENLPEGKEIAIQIKPGSLKTIPQLSANAKVVRCAETSDSRFKVSCKILKVLRNK
ncbi:PilZ domain-containing protein [Kaarinaea lacus]